MSSPLSLVAQLQLLVNGGAPVDLYCILCDLHAEGHHTLSSWKALASEQELVEAVIAQVFRHEAGFQLNGFGIWCVQMIFTHSNDPSCRNIRNMFGKQQLVEDLLRIGLEHPVYDKCFLLLLEICQVGLKSFEDIYDILTSISDQLPMPIRAVNFSCLLKFIRRGMEIEPSSEKKALMLLGNIVSGVEINYKVEFFVPDLGQQLKPYFSDNCKDEDLTRYAAKVVRGITLLNNVHPRQFWQCGILNTLVILLLSSDSPVGDKLKPETLANIMDALSAISHDPLIRGHISKRVTPLILASKIDGDYLCCLQAAAELFSKLFLQVKFQSSLPLSATNVNAVLSKVRKNTSDDDSQHLLQFSGDGLTGEQGESNYCCGFLIPALSVCLDILEEHIEKKKDVVSDKSQDEEHDHHNVEDDHRGLIDEPVQEVTDPIIIVGKVIQLLSRYQSFTAYMALNSILERGRDILYPFFFDIKSFNLKYLILVDAFLAFGGHQDLCWMHTVLQNDKELMEHSKKVPNTYPIDTQPAPNKKPPPVTSTTTNVGGINGAQRPNNQNNLAIVHGRSSIQVNVPAGEATTSSSVGGTPGTSNNSSNINNGLPLPSMQRRRSSVVVPDAVVPPEQMLADLLKNENKDTTPNESIKILGLKIFLEHKSSFETFLEDWEVKPTSSICRHIVAMYIVSKTVGITLFDPVISLNDFVEMILEMLREDRLGLSRYPGMHEKCLQVLVCMGYEAAQMAEYSDRRSFSSGFNFISFAVSICDFALKRLILPESTQDANLMYVYLSVLVSCSSHDRLCRRRIVTSFSKICDAFLVLDQSSSIAPLLRLTLHVTDSIGKVDRDGEESLLSLVIRGLRMLFAGGYDMGVLSCSVIAEAGSIHPNLAFRLFMRREVEDILALLLSQGGIRSRLLVDESFASSIEDLDFEDLNTMNSVTLEEQCMRASLSRNRNSLMKNIVQRETENPQTMLLLRACIVCVKDFNPKPFWTYTSWSYGWWVYDQGIARRPLLRQMSIESLASICRTADNSTKVLILALCLDYASSLMATCQEGANGIVGKPAALAADPVFQKSVRDNLLTFILPILPNALAIIGNEENHRSTQVNFSRWLTMNDSTAVTFWTDPTNFISDKANDAYRAISKSIRMPTVVSSIRRRSNMNEGAVTQARNSSIPPLPDHLRKSPAMGADSSHKSATRASVSAQAQTELHEEEEINIAMELLTEKTVETVYAFLCTNDSKPMHTYLSNKKLFDKHPVATGIVHAMKCYPENKNVQRRAIEIMKVFVQNEVDIQTFCYYAPNILIVAINLHDDTVDVHLAFSTIVARLAKVDELTRTNMITYSVHRGLAAIIRQKNVETSYLSLIALQNLAASPDVALQITAENSNVLSAVIFALDVFANDIRILIEGLKCLSFFKTTPEYKRILETRGGEGTFKKSRKTLMRFAREDRNTGIYSSHEVEAVLSMTYQFHCVIS